MLIYHRIISIKYIICQATIGAANPWQVAATPFATNWILGGVKLELQNQLQNVEEFNGIQSFPSAWVGNARLWHVRPSWILHPVSKNPLTRLAPPCPTQKKHSINICFSYQPVRFGMLRKGEHWLRRGFFTARHRLNTTRLASSVASCEACNVTRINQEVAGCKPLCQLIEMFVIYVYIYTVPNM